MRNSLAIVLTFIGTIAITPVAAILAAPVADGPVLIVLPPWADAEAVLAASGGRLIGPTRAPFAMLAAYPSPTAARSAPGHGAWAVFNGGAIALLCGASNA
ncbi:hypothetical protein FHY55_07035 [Oceanicola sp. D3]|uniref:hypothetical protein n=1 Tax=Oceanicola sp. D3 TaxID=2587163 RepID=UPI001124BDD1|nr:hypothetical protein [Oceanicola sp. D3]QDC09013.1 hypothetical protein FHY55_07035 [Oceanicola sp. D3]